MQPQSQFRGDLKKEQLLQAYLDGLYTGRGARFERMHDSDSQHNGIDVVFTDGGNTLLTDEKSQLDYIGKSLGTFAFEIGYFKNGIHKNGWLFDEKKLTTHYMLVTDIFLKKGRAFTGSDDIASLRLLWLSRAKLLDALGRIGLDATYCAQAEIDARESGLNGKIDMGRSNHYFFLSNQKAEAPFNLIIKRPWLLTLGKELHP